jgi:hypothetical protein
VRFLRLLLLPCIAFVALAPAAHAQMHVAVRVSPVADFAHQLDCVAEVIHNCGLDDYRELWRARFLRDRADSAALREWRVLRARYDVAVQVDSAEVDRIGRQHRWVSLAERWRVAGLQARSFDDYSERLALVLLPQDRARVDAVVARLRPRFMAWWDAESRDRLTRGRDSLELLLAGTELRAMLDRVRRFYGATGPGSDTVTLTLVSRAGLGSRNTNAEVVEGWAVQEMLPDASPAREVGVTLHEVAHLLLSLAPDAEREAIAAELGRGGMAGRATRSLLDEGLATAFGNGMVERALRPADRWTAYAERPLSFYNDSIIDAAGKALLPTLDSLLLAGARLRDPRTLVALRRTLESAMGQRLLSPRALLHDVWGFVDNGVADPFEVGRQVRRALRPGVYSMSVDSAGGAPTASFRHDPWLGALVVARAESLDRIAARGAFRASEVAAIRRAAANGPVLYGARRANGARTWVIVARSDAEARPLVERLAALARDADGVAAAR